jgi:hypothetical protein
MNRDEKIRRTGLMLTAVLFGMIVYSLVVIKTRGRLPEPENLTRLQRILRGL